MSLSTLSCVPTLFSHVGIDHVHEVARHAGFGQPLAVVDAEDLHALVVVEVGEQLGRDEEVLAGFGLACHLDEGVVHGTLRATVHTLFKLRVISIRARAEKGAAYLVDLVD